jgi:hypothetical protein
MNIYQTGAPITLSVELDVVTLNVDLPNGDHLELRFTPENAADMGAAVTAYARKADEYRQAYIS